MSKMLFTKRDLLKITVPLIIQQVLATTIGMIDTMMVSSAGEAAVSGVSLCTTLDILLITMFTALVSGGAVVIAQFLGRRDMDLVKDSSKQLLYATTGVAVLITTLVLTVRGPLFNLLFGGVEADVMKNAQSYFFFIALSFPFLGLYDAGAALFRTMGNSMVTMIVSIGMNLLNVAGNAIFIYALGMGAAGAAISTLIARIIGSFVMVYLLHNKKNLIYVEKLFHYRPNFHIIKSILRIGVPNGIENSMFQFGKLLTQSLISSMGTAMIAANAVGNSLANFQYMPGGAIGAVMITVVGRCIGAQEKEQAKKYARILVGATYACLGVVVLGTWIFAEPLIGLYNLSPESTEAAKSLILSHAACAIAIWPLAFTLPNAFRAASDVKFSMKTSVFSMWVFRVALSYVFAKESISVFGFTLPGLGMSVLGVWMAMYVDWVFRSIWFVIRFISGKWLTKYKAVQASK